MHLKCPNCQTAVELLQSDSAVAGATVDGMSDLYARTTCPNCNSHLSVVNPASVPARVPTQKIGQFELIERLGQGQSAMVWKARDTELGRLVAIKIPRTLEILEQGSELFLKEAQAIAALDHPNIVRLYDVKRDVDMLVIVTEFVAGTTLQQHLRNGRLPHAEAARICLHLATALQHAHERGVVHRDIKPGNVLITSEGELKITDFGLAKRDAADITLTLDGQILGTPAYMSPEQARGESQATDCRSDVYSLGVVLYELLTGCLPFSGSSQLILEKVIRGEAKPPRKVDATIPRDLETICQKAMATEPAERYQTAADLAADLQHYLDGSRIHAQRSGVLEIGWKWTRRHPWQMATVLSIVVAAFALIAGTGGAANPQPAVETRMVSIDTEPTDAQLVFYLRDPATGEPMPETSFKPATRSKAQLLLPVGRYLVVAVLDDGRFHEVERRVHSASSGLFQHYAHEFNKVLPDGIVELPKIKIPALEVVDGMAKFEGSSRFMIGDLDSAEIPVHDRVVQPFFLDCREVTVGEFIGVKKWVPTTWGPDTPQPSDDMAVSFLLFDEATAIAERCGKRLMTEAEYEFAATLGGTRTYPWGNTPSTAKWTIQKVGEPAFDVLPTRPPVFGLYSNVGELTSSWAVPYPANRFISALESAQLPYHRIVRGAPPHVCTGDLDGTSRAWSPRHRIHFERLNVPKNVGFRMARSVRPRLSPKDFERILPSTVLKEL